MILPVRSVVILHERPGSGQTSTSKSSHCAVLKQAIALLLKFCFYNDCVRIQNLWEKREKGDLLSFIGKHWLT